MHVRAIHVLKNLEQMTYGLDKLEFHFENIPFLFGEYIIRPTFSLLLSRFHTLKFHICSPFTTSDKNMALHAYMQYCLAFKNILSRDETFPLNNPRTTKQHYIQNAFLIPWPRQQKNPLGSYFTAEIMHIFQWYFFSPHTHTPLYIRPIHHSHFPTYISRFPLPILPYTA